MYAIIGATGNTGSVIAEKLLAHKEKVRVIGRDAKRLEGLVQKGAEAFVAEVTDKDALIRAFSGAKAVYLMIPPNPASPGVRDDQERVSDALVEAVRKASVEYSVLLSSVGADKSEKTGPVVGLHNFEQKLNAIGSLKALHLRPAYFMENLLAQIGIIQHFGGMAGPLRGELKLPMIATQDIGAAAADELINLNFSGKQTRELLGQRDLTYLEVASVVGKAIGKADLGYLQMSSEQIKPALVQMGMSGNMADLLLEMTDALNSGHMVELETRSAKNTTATSIETFVAEHIAPKLANKSAGG